MLLRQNRGVSSVEINKTGIRDFERYAKKYGIDYAIRKDSSEVPGIWSFSKPRMWKRSMPLSKNIRHPC